MLDLSFEFKASGPLFDGRADAALKAYTEAIERRYSEFGADIVRRRIGVVARNETGYYQSHIRNRAVAEGYLITDSRVIYGPWLEGISERNRTTPFKGYHTFRLMTTQLDAFSVAFAQNMIDPYLHQMGGKRT